MERPRVLAKGGLHGGKPALSANFVGKFYTRPVSRVVRPAEMRGNLALAAIGTGHALLVLSQRCPKLMRRSQSPTSAPPLVPTEFFSPEDPRPFGIPPNKHACPHTQKSGPCDQAGAAFFVCGGGKTLPRGGRNLPWAFRRAPTHENRANARFRDPRAMALGRRRPLIPTPSEGTPQLARLTFALVNSVSSSPSSYISIMMSDPPTNSPLT